MLEPKQGFKVLSALERAAGRYRPASKTNVVASAVPFPHARL
jgi:hypothetical protein